MPLLTSCESPINSSIIHRGSRIGKILTNEPAQPGSPKAVWSAGSTLSEAGLTEAESWRAWAALGQGTWSSERIIRQWTRVVEREGQWQATEYGG